MAAAANAGLTTDGFHRILHYRSNRLTVPQGFPDGGLRGRQREALAVSSALR